MQLFPNGQLGSHVPAPPHMAPTHENSTTALQQSIFRLEYKIVGLESKMVGLESKLVGFQSLTEHLFDKLQALMDALMIRIEILNDKFDEGELAALD